MQLHSLANANDAPRSYGLNTGPEAAKRLELQDELIGLPSRTHLLSAGLSQDQVVVDVGCGNGMMTQFMANQVGPNGVVYAVDISEAQLETARSTLSQHTNVHFIHSDIYTLNEKQLPQADLMHARFLLMHLTKPEEALKVMKDLLKPGGILVLEEPINSECHGGEGKLTGPMEAFINYGKDLGVDYDIGLRLKEMCIQAGLTEVDEHSFQQTISADQAKPFFTMGFNEWLAKAQVNGMTSVASSKEWLEDIQNISEDVTLPTLVYVKAKKSKA